MSHNSIGVLASDRAYELTAILLSELGKKVISGYDYIPALKCGVPALWSINSGVFYITVEMLRSSLPRDYNIKFVSKPIIVNADFNNGLIVNKELISDSIGLMNCLCDVLINYSLKKMLGLCGDINFKLDTDVFLKACVNDKLIIKDELMQLGVILQYRPDNKAIMIYNQLLKQDRPLMIYPEDYLGF